MFRAKGKLFSLLTACFALLLTLVMGVATMNLQPKTASAETTGKFVKVTNTLDDWSGDYLIVYEAGNVAFNGGLTTLDAVSNTIPVTIKNGAIESNSTTDAAKFTIDSNGYIKSANGYYIGQTSNANGLKSSTSTKYVNKFTVNNDDSVDVVSGGAYLRYNATSGQYRFRYYKSSSYSSQKAIALYKWEGLSCEHANKTTTTVKADCTTAGSETVTCNDCGVEVSNTEIPALGHDFGDEVTYEREGNQHKEIGTCNICGETTEQTEACTLTYENVSNEDKTHNVTSTCSVCNESVTTEKVACTFDDGVLNGTNKTYTCEYCEYSYSEEVPTYTVTYSVPNGVDDIESEIIVEGEATMMPIASTVEGYTFVGWVKEELIEKSEEEPEYLKENATYIVTEDVTFYALYSYAEGTDAYVLVKDANDLAVGKEIVIVASKYNVALSTTQNTNNRAQAAVTKNEDNITFENDVQILTLKAGTVDGTYAFYTGSGYLYAASSGSNHLKTQETNNANGSWKIEVTSAGVATIKAQGTNTRNWLRYNSSNNPPLFSCYSSGQADVSIYMKAGTTYYVTKFNTCVHERTDEAIKEASCTESGSRTVTCLDCEAVIEAEVLPAHGHDYVDGVCTYCEAVNPSSIVYDGWYYIVLNGKYLDTTTLDNNKRYKPVEFTPSEEVEVKYVFRFEKDGDTYTMYDLTNGEYVSNVTVVTQDDYSVRIYNQEGNVFSHNANSNANYVGFYKTTNNYANNITLTPVEVAKVGSASVTVGDDVALNYYVSMSEDLGEENVEMRFLQNDAEVDTVKGMLCEDGRYKFSLTLPPQRMADVFTVEVLYNGTVIATQEEYSVQAYATKQLAKSNITKELKQLIVDMLYYGAAAQEYKGYKADALATNGLSETASEFVKPEEIENWYVNNTEISSYPAYFTNVGVWFDYNNQIYVTLNTTENVKITVDGEEVAVDGTRVLLGGILATEYDKQFEIKLYSTKDGEEVLMQTLTYSVNFYVYQICEGGTKNQKMVNLAKALYCYGQSALAYQESVNA